MIRVQSGSAEYAMYEQFLRELTREESIVNPVPYIDLLDWTSHNRANLTPDRRFDIAAHPFLVDIYKDTTPVKVIYKASQMGASEWAISYAFHACDVRDATVLYISPSDTHVSDFSTARIGPAIEASDYLLRIVVEETKDKSGRRGTDRTTLKRVRNRFLWLRGAMVKADGRAAQLKSIDADILILDEVDEMDPRAPAIAAKRIGHSLIAEEIWISTPTYSGYGIHRKWNETDQREWFVKCPHCGKRQVLEIENCVTEWDKLGRPVSWHGQPGNAWIACTKCKRKMDRIAAGEWVATYPDRSKTIAGYHLTKMFSPITPLLDIVQRLQTTDETERKETINQDLGRPYFPRGGRLTSDVLDKCIMDYEPRLNGNPVFMGVDVGAVLNVIIRQKEDPETGISHLLYAGVVDDFDALIPLINEYGVVNCVVDALPETRSARTFQAGCEPGMVWLAYYVGQRTGLKIPEPMKWDAKDGIVTIDRTRLLDAMFGRFYDRTAALPVYIRDVPDYYRQVTDPIRIVRDSVAHYTDSGTDHYAHAEAYCLAAASGEPPVPASEIIEYNTSIYKTEKKVHRRA